MGESGNGHSPGKMLALTPTPGRPAAIVAGSPGLACDSHQVFDTHLPFVWRNLRRLGVPHAQVEDAAQDVFLVVHRRWETWDPARSTLETWLFGIVLRVARNYRRSQQRLLAWILPARSRGKLPDVATAADGPAEILARRETVAFFERALAQLDDTKRAIFLLVDVEQLPVPEAALALGINLNTAYWRLRKARLAFQKVVARMRSRESALARGNRP